MENNRQIVGSFNYSRGTADTFGKPHQDVPLEASALNSVETGKVETLNRDLNSQLSRHEDSNRHGSGGAAEGDLAGYILGEATLEEEKSRLSMRNLPPVYGTKQVEAAFTGIADRVGDDQNGESNPLLDTKGENEIAFNLAKLKEDLKNQAEAISELRKQAWDNTGSTVHS